MKFFSAVLCSLVFVPFSFGQLTVKPIASHHDSYLYVNGTLLFIKQDVNLQKNADASITEASIYLRREGQLIQGEGGNSINSGNGLISVFQKGSSNAYDYNYWSSPVSDGSSGNGNFGISMFYAPINQTASIKAIHSSGLDGMANPLSISSRWIHTYSGNSYSSWFPVYGRTEIPAGYGFSMKGVNGVDPTMVDGTENNSGNSQRYDFRGKPNNGPIAIAVKKEEFTLIGNPYPSTFDLSLFLMENSGSGSISTDCYGSITRKPATTGVAYFWDSEENGTSHYLKDYVGGYGTFSPVDPCTDGIYERAVFRNYGSEDWTETGTTGNHYDRRFLPIGQGFMVEGATDSELLLENHHRVFKKQGDQGYSGKVLQVHKAAKDLMQIPKLRLQAVINDTYVRNFTLAFWPTARPDLDLGMDAKSFDLAPTDIGWLHKDENYIIDVRPYNEMEEIPLFLKVDDGQAEISLSLIGRENLELERVYLIDTLYDLYYPLQHNSFHAMLKQGNYHGRFKIGFRYPMNLKEETTSVNVSVLYNKESCTIEIQGDTEDGITSVSLFDLTGKRIFSSNVAQTDFFSIPTSYFANSVYIVRVLTEGRKEFSAKVNIHNRH